MEQEEKRCEQEADWDRKMGGEEMSDSGFLVEEDVEAELGSGFCMEVELILAGQVSVGSDKHQDREELDWFVIASQTQEEDEMEADSGSMKNAETEAEMDDQTEEVKEEEMKGALDVFLWPVEESGRHVRISLEEVERYYRFSCCCHWLVGRCQMFYLSSISCMYHKMILPLSQSFFHNTVLPNLFVCIILTEIWFCHLNAASCNCPLLFEFTCALTLL